MYVYLIKNGDLHKIGITGDLERRMRELKPDRIVCTVEQVNAIELEKFLHQKFADKRIPQSEYFRLSKNEVADAIIEMNDAEEDSEFSNLEQSKQEILDDTQEFIQSHDADRVLWTEHAHAEGIVTTLPRFMLDVVATGNWPEGELNPSQRTIAAATRLLDKEKALKPIREASDLGELAEASRLFYNDLICFYAWCITNGELNPLTQEGEEETPPEITAQTRARMAEIVQEARDEGLEFAEEKRGWFGSLKHWLFK